MDWTHPYDQEQDLFLPVPNEASGSGTSSRQAQAPSSSQSHVDASQSVDEQQDRQGTGNRRGRQRDLDWERYKPDIKRLYIDQKSSLEKTMDFMKENHGFDASSKMYKEKFKNWGWGKNLPHRYAQWMVQKAQHRRREESKDTIFFYGGSVYDSTIAENRASRTKRDGPDPDLMDIETPAAITYETPGSHANSPRDVASPHWSRRPTLRDGVGSNAEPERDVMDLVAVLEDSPLPLSWKGETLLELTTKFDAARSQRLAGADAQVEDLYVEVLEGYTHILGATHKDTIHVALTLATFYAEEDQMQEANGIIQETLRDHLERWGIKHKQTQQHLLDVVGILNGWNRPNEAFALLSRAKELVDIAERRTTNSDARPRSKKTATSSKAAETDRLLDIAHTIRVVGGPENVAYGVNMARNHASANAEGVEALLLSILDHCEKHPMGLEIQHLKARAELLRWYKKNDTVLGHISSFVRAKEVFGILWSSFQWDYERSDSLDMMEASLELSSAMLHANFDNLAEDIFGIVSDQARTLFARDMERAIWVDITIGLVYQKYRSWAVSSRWFQQALASAIFKYDDDDGIVKALHNAMRRHHFTYLTDDGKPFRTIFGVCGLVIRPNRLHLE